MSLRTRNYSDKSLWNPANGALNAIMVPTLGEVSSYFANIGATSPPQYGSQDDLGKKVCISITEIGSYTNTANGTLYEGVYQVVQIDSSANVSECGVGMSAYHKFLPTSGQNIVTNYSQAVNYQSTIFFAGVFLTPNPVAGNYTVIFVGGGRVNVSYKAGITNGAPAIGDNVNANVAGGFFDDVSAAATGQTNYVVGNATIAPASSTLSPIYIAQVIDRI